MLDWPVTSSYPTGYLRADGTAVSRTSYADLFALIGTTYGVGDNSTTFNLPNLVAAGSGSPVKIIKASLGGTVEPSTVAHASSHIRGGSDIIDADRNQIDFVPSYYTRDSSPAQAGATTDLTAHLKGIDNRIRAISNVQSTIKTDTTSNTSASFVDITGMSVTISPIFNNSKVLITYVVNLGAASTNEIKVRLMRGGTAIAIGTTGSVDNSTQVLRSDAATQTYTIDCLSFTFLDSPSTTSATTYKLQWLTNTGTVYLNRRGNDNALNTASTITVQEVLV
jgi:microcystin-dependent protein